jgi:hypothetical protein
MALGIRICSCSGTCLIIFFRYFLPILFAAAGVNSQNQRLTLNFANTIVSACGALIGTSLTDKGLFRLSTEVSI